jgi:hypothetical protein
MLAATPGRATSGVNRRRATRSRPSIRNRDTPTCRTRGTAVRHSVGMVRGLARTPARSPSPRLSCCLKTTCDRDGGPFIETGGRGDTARRRPIWPGLHRRPRRRLATARRCGKTVDTQYKPRRGRGPSGQTGAPGAVTADAPGAGRPGREGPGRGGAPPSHSSSCSSGILTAV